MGSARRHIKIKIFGYLAWGLLYLLNKTIKWVRNDMAGFTPGRNVICAFWHGRQLMLAPLYSEYCSFLAVVMLISAHTDGRIIAKACKRFGINSVEGSSTRGGVRALGELMGSLKSGCSAAITPDGPKGPIYKAKNGILKLSQKTGAPIYPVSYSASSFWQFKSWDAMILPKPFSRGVCIIGEPITVPASCSEAEFDVMRIELENRLNEVTKKSDEFNYN